MLERYSHGTNGPCGPACLAVIERRPIRDVLADWQPLFGDYRGWAAWKELRQYLKKKGYKIKQCRFTGEINPTGENFVICRVQWVGPSGESRFAGWKHWSEAAAHTHFILVVDHNFFCSEEGWYSLDNINDYLEGKPGLVSGVVTSYLEVTR